MTQRKRLYNKTAAGQRIRSCRERLGLSRQKMAEQIGKAEKYYADIERGYCGMSLETMIEISECLGLTLDYMIFGEEADSQELPEDFCSAWVSAMRRRGKRLWSCFRSIWKNSLAATG